MAERVARQGERDAAQVSAVEAPTHEQPGRTHGGGPLAMQRVIGNRAVARAMAGSRTDAPVARRVPWVAPADHASEAEADTIADRVVRSLRGGGAAVSRPSLRAEGVQREAVAGATAVSPAIDGDLAATGGGGRPLAGELRSPLERAFGADLGGVRIHDDARAHALSRGLQAHAFTRGQDVYFARGAYRPHVASGVRLLAHELTHVLQQRGGGGGVIHRYAASVPSSNTAEDEVSFEWSGSNTFENQVEGTHDFLTPETAVSATLAPVANLATTDVSAGVLLNVSDGGQLAVEALPGSKQAKAYYSTAAKLEESNEKLAATGSSFTMREVEGQSVTVRKDSTTRTLSKIYPVNRQTPLVNERTPTRVKETVGPQEMVTRQQCVDMAAALVGSHQGGSTVGVVREIVEPLVDTVMAGARRQLLSTGISGVKMAASSNVGTLGTLIEDVRTTSDAADDGALADRLVPILTEVKAKLATGDPPTQATQQFVLASLTVQTADQLPEFARLRVLSDDVTSFDATLKTVLQLLQQYALYLVLKDDERRELLVDSAGIDEQARPDVGETYKITYLERVDGVWNYHWAGVVARDGDDSVTLENYTRDYRSEAAVKYVDPRWYFQMFGVGQQSFHRYHSASAQGGLTLTQAGRKRRETDTTPELPVSAASRRSSEVAEMLAQIRAALVSGSVTRKTNAAYGEVLGLLRECALLAIDAREDDSLYDAIATKLETVKTKAAEARSTKWGDTGTKRNSALADMLKAVKALHETLAGE